MWQATGEQSSPSCLKLTRPRASLLGESAASRSERLVHRARPDEHVLTGRSRQRVKALRRTAEFGLCVWIQNLYTYDDDSKRLLGITNFAQHPRAARKNEVGQWEVSPYVDKRMLGDTPVSASLAIPVIYP